MSTTDDTTIAISSRGHRLRRAATRTAVVLGFAVGGWLVATGSASADTAPPQPPASASLRAAACRSRNARARSAAEEYCRTRPPVAGA